MESAGGWTEERVELLKKLWLEGLSASQIAGVLGEGVTRNAVIGKVHRLKLTGRAKPASSAPRARATPRPATGVRRISTGASRPSSGIASMLTETHSAETPWRVVLSNDKRRARLELIRVVLDGIDYADKDKTVVGTVDDNLVLAPERYIREHEHS